MTTRILVCLALLATARTVAAQQPTDSAARADSIARARADSLHSDSVRTALMRTLQAQLDSVEKAREDSLRKFQLAAVVVTATRLSQVDERAPVQVEQLNIPINIPVPTAAPLALMKLPGISSFDDQGTPFQPEIQVRGFTLSPIAGSPQGISVFLNGVRQNEPDAQEVNFDLLPMAAVDQSSLVRGSNILFGRNSLGGTLLFMTKRGGDKPEGEVEVGGGSFGQKLLGLTAGGKAGGMDGFLAVTANDQTGWRQATSGYMRNVFATIGHQWGATHDSGDIALDILYAHDTIYQAGSLPASYANTLPRINYTPGDFFAPDAYMFTLRGNQPLGGGILRAIAFYRRNNYEQFNVNVPPANPSTDAFTNNKSGGGTLEWTTALRLGLPVGLTVGGDYEQDAVDYKVTLLGSGDTPDTVTTLAQVSPQDNAGGYVQAIASVTNNLHITGGLRVDYVRIPYTDQLVDSNSGTSSYTRFSPAIGVNYSFSDQVKAFAAYRSGFRAPAALELACASPEAPCNLPSALGNDPPLDPVTTQDYELGFDLDLAKGTSLDVSGFWIDVKNDILAVSPTLISSYFINAAATRRAGIEVSGQAQLPQGFRLLGQYGYIKATFQSVELIATEDTAPKPTQPGDIFPNSPLHQWRVGLALDRRLGTFFFNGEFDVNGYSSQFMRGDESNRRAQLPAYQLADFRGRLTFHRLAVEFSIENLFNTTYNSFGVEGVDRLAPPPGSHITLGEDNAIPVPFLTPGLPRRFTLTVSARL